MEHLADVVRRALVDAQKKMEDRARVKRSEANAALNRAKTSTSFGVLNMCEDVMCDYQLACGDEFKARQALKAHDEKQR